MSTTVTEPTGATGRSQPKTGYVEKLSEKRIAAFWSKVETAEPDACWNWQAGKNQGGYGFFWVGGRGGTNVTAHRLSWELAYGLIPDSLWVLHRCDNPACVNPAHLFLGTDKDNTADMDAKGRRVHNDMSRARAVAVTLPNHISARRRAQTHCCRGHVLSGENLYVHHGVRYCRTCRRHKTAESRAAKKAREEQVA